MSKCTILGDNTTRDCSEACNSTRLRLVQLQDSEPVTHDIITQIAHLAMLLIIHIASYCNIQQQLENIPSDAKAQCQSV